MKINLNKIKPLLEKKEYIRVYNEELEDENKLTPLNYLVILSDVELPGPIFNDYDLQKWYKRFVLRGGGCFNTSIRNHTFVCNTVESAYMLKSFILKRFKKPKPEEIFGDEWVQLEAATL